MEENDLRMANELVEKINTKLATYPNVNIGADLTPAIDLGNGSSLSPTVEGCTFCQYACQFDVFLKDSAIAATVAMQMVFARRSLVPSIRQYAGYIQMTARVF